MKSGVIGVFFACLMLVAGNARAEHKLLVTEVLDAGQIEAEATFEYSHLKADLDANFPLEEDELTVNAQETFYSLGIGLGHDLEVSALIPYVIFEKEKIDETEETDGLGDLTLEAKYRVFEEEEMPFTLTAGLDVKLDTADEDDAGTGTTDISPFLAMSKEMAEHIEGYAVYRAVLVNHDGSDEHSLTFGVEAELNESLTLDAALRVAHNTSEDEVSSYQTYGLEVALYAQVARNLYLIPAVGVERSTSIDIEEGSDKIEIDPANLYRAGLSVYYLY